MEAVCFDDKFKLLASYHDGCWVTNSTRRALHPVGQSQLIDTSALLYPRSTDWGFPAGAALLSRAGGGTLWLLPWDCRFCEVFLI